MFGRIRKGDYVLITDNTQEEYLQIGQVITVQHYTCSDDVMFYRVQFIDKICEYTDSLKDKCKVIKFER